MIDSLLGLSLTAAFVLPGFIIQFTARRRLDAPSSGVDLELVLRCLAWALVYQAVIAFWTAYLARRLEDPGLSTQWVGQLILYVVVGLILVPLVIGLVLAEELRDVDAGGENPKALLARMLGAPSSTSAWVLRVAPILGEDAWVVIRTSQGRTIAGLFGGRSIQPLDDKAVDLYIQEEWVVDSAGNFLQRYEPPRGVWVSRDQIETMHVTPKSG